LGVILLATKVLIAQNSAFLAYRLPRTAKALKKAGYDVEILNWDRGVNSDVVQKATAEFADEGITVHSIWCGNTPYGKGIYTVFKKILFVLKVIFFMLKYGKNYKVVHAIDFDVAFPIFLARMIRPDLKFKLIYDIADFVETFHSPFPKFIREIVKCISHEIMKISSNIILPDENRLANIPEQYHRKVIIVNNSIPTVHINNQFTAINLDETKINILYYGALSRDRGIDFLLELDKMKNIAVWIAGKGELEEKVRECAKLKSHLNFLGYLEFEKMIAIASIMDLIYIVYDPSFQHNQLASPNKLYEAMFLGKPCIVAKGTSIDVLVKKYDIGYVIDYNMESLFQLLSSLKKENLLSLGKNAKNIYPKYSWEEAENNLLNLYDQLVR
jgi:glycosyltransferase involved in cell wall biosynthesis